MIGRLIKSLTVAVLMILVGYLAGLPLKSVAPMTLIPIACAIIDVLFAPVMSLAMLFIVAVFLWWINPFHLQEAFAHAAATFGGLSLYHRQGALHGSA